MTLEAVEDTRLRFSLPHEHPGHAHFRGCSGAPITDASGKLVGLVAGGCEQNNSVFGVHLANYSAAIIAAIDGEWNTQP